MNPFIISLAIRLTVLLAAGALATMLVRRSTYALRHVVLAATLACVVALPLAMLSVPEWRVAMLPPSPEQPRSFTITEMPARATMSAARAAPATAAAPKSLHVTASPIIEKSDATIHPVLITGQLEPSTPKSLVTDAQMSYALSSLGAAFSIPAAPTLFLAIWMFGVVVGLAWIAIGRYGLTRIRRDATALATYEWRTILESEAMHAGVARRVALLSSPRVSGPVTWGVLSPVIVLPEASLAWTHERKRVVVMHEMAHIARRDSATQLLATFACVAYWVHPLVILAARRLRAECERACDERVLARGTPPADYAAHLLDVARFSRSFGASSIVSVAMARPSQLEGRLLAVLRSTPRKSQLSHRTRVLGTVSAIALLMTISAFRPVERTAKASEAHHAMKATATVVADTGDDEPAIPPVPQVPAMAPVAPRTPIARIAPIALSGSKTPEGFMAPTQPAEPIAFSAPTPAAPRAFIAPTPASAPTMYYVPAPASAPFAPMPPLASLPPAAAFPATPESIGRYRAEAYVVQPAPLARPAAYAIMPHVKPDTMFEKSVSAHAGGTLVLDLDTGGEIHITGTDDSKVTVSTTLGGTDWRETTVDLTANDGGARLESKYERSSNVERFDNTFTIMVPKRFNVRLTSAGGSVTISGVEGKFSGNTGGGTIAIDHARGEASLSTGGGDVRVSESHLDGSISTGGGSIKFMNVTGNLVPASGSEHYSYHYGPGSSYSTTDGSKYWPKGMDSVALRSMRIAMKTTEEAMKRMNKDMARDHEVDDDYAEMARDLDTSSMRIARITVERTGEAMKRAQKAMARDRVSMERMRIRSDDDSSDDGDDSDSERNQASMDRMRARMERNQARMDSAQIIIDRDQGAMDTASWDFKRQFAPLKYKISQLDRGGTPSAWKVESDDPTQSLRISNGVLLIDKAGGSIKVSSAPHGAHLSTGGGSIVVAKSSGAVSAVTGGGSISILQAEGATKATTGAGDVVIAVSGDAAEPVNVASGTGSVEIQLPRDANATLDLETAYTKNFGRKTSIKGDWELKVTETDDWDTEQGSPRKYVRVRQTIGHGGPVIRVRTVNGDIKLKKGS